jgi:hypothetical protein
MLPPTDNRSVHELLTERSIHTAIIRQHLQTTQNQIKVQADKNRTDKEFQVGDKVFLKLQPYAQSSLVNQPFPKLSYKFFGSYSVLEKIGRSAYKLELLNPSGLSCVTVEAIHS